MNRTSFIGLLLVIVVGGYVAATVEWDGAPMDVPGEARSIVILPFVDHGRRSESSQAAAHLTAEVTRGLGERDGFQVESAESTAAFELERADAHRIARDLGAEYALEGAVTDAGERIRISAQLVTAEPESHIWAARYDVSLEEMAGIAHQVVFAVANAVEESSNNSLQRTRESSGEFSDAEQRAAERKR